MIEIIISVNDENDGRPLIGAKHDQDVKKKKCNQKHQKGIFLLFMRYFGDKGCLKLSANLGKRWGPH